MCYRDCCNSWNKAICTQFQCNRTSSRSKGSNTSVSGVWVEEVAAQVGVEVVVVAREVVEVVLVVVAVVEAQKWGLLPPAPLSGFAPLLR